MNKKIVFLCDGSYTRKGMQRYAGCAFFGGPLTFESWADDSDWPTNNTAELNSILRAMEVAIFDEQRTNVEILTDSEYACKALNNYCFKWRENGWINSAGDPVANQTLIKDCLHLMDEHKVVLEWIPREENRIADRMAKCARDGIYECEY